MNIEVVKTAPLLKSFIKDKGYVTNVKKRLEMDVVHFLSDLRCVSSLTNLTKDFVSEYNVLLKDLEDSNLLTLSESKWKIGIFKINTTSDVLTKWLDTSDLHFYNRSREEIDYPLVLNGKPSECSIVTTGGMEFETFVALKYISKKHNAITRGIEFRLTLADMKRLLKTKYCKISGVLLTLEGDHHLSLDRVDASIGYTKTNTIAVSALVNSLKNDLIESGNSTKGMTNKQRKKMLLTLAELL